VPGAFALPYSANAPGFDSLPEISLGREATLVAVKADRTVLVSLNVHDLQPGDVFLFRSPDSWTASIRARFNLIVRYQAAILDADHSVWTHVGILDDNFQVWDAMPHLNVRCRSLREVLRERRIITVRRPLAQIDPVRLALRLAAIWLRDCWLELKRLNLRPTGRSFAPLSSVTSSGAQPLNHSSEPCRLSSRVILRRMACLQMSKFTGAKSLTNSRQLPRLLRGHKHRLLHKHPVCVPLAVPRLPAVGLGRSAMASRMR
jgi:hypothetical protein